MRLVLTMAVALLSAARNTLNNCTSPCDERLHSRDSTQPTTTFPIYTLPALLLNLIVLAALITPLRKHECEAHQRTATASAYKELAYQDY